jgi:acyl carrier protein
MKLVEIGLNSIGTIEFFVNIEQKYNFEFSDDVTLLGNEISIKELLDSIKN